jgi:hypothetical protein
MVLQELEIRAPQHAREFRSSPKSARYKRGIEGAKNSFYLSDATDKSFFSHKDLDQHGEVRVLYFALHGGRRMCIGFAVSAVSLSFG